MNEWSGNFRFFRSAVRKQRRNMQHVSRHSKLELRGPRRGLKVGACISRGARSRGGRAGRAFAELLEQQSPNISELLEQHSPPPRYLEAA
eukprot:6107632-Alexandrium_andersonii.AAC.1